MAQYDSSEAARQPGDRRTRIGQSALISEEPQYRARRVGCACVAP